MTTALASRAYTHYIGGRDVATNEASYDRISPASGEVVAHVPIASKTTVDTAVSEARQAFDFGDWPDSPGISRTRILNEYARLIRHNREHLAYLETEESGKPIKLARRDIDGAADHAEYAAGLATQMSGQTFTNLGNGLTGLVLREPAGVVALITPWNFPGLILNQKLPYALAAGCAVVVKPSEMTSGTTLEMARLATEAGVPDSVINVVLGTGEAGQLIVDDPRIDLISFTGSTRTGRQIARSAAENVTRLSLELGGKAASIVFADSDLDKAVDGVLFGVFFNQGECCVSGARLLVEDTIADDFVQRLARRARTLTVGDPFDDATDVGALISPEHMEKVLGYINSGSESGAELVAGGTRLNTNGLGNGTFVDVTIFDHVTSAMPIFQEEIFGPVLTVTRFTDVGEAISLANAVSYGLANSVWTSNIDTAITAARRLESGTVWINTTIEGGPQLPFGGYKESGYGREMGEAGFEEFTQLKTVTIQVGDRPGSRFG